MWLWVLGCGRHGAVSESAQSGQHSSCNHQMPLRVAAASTPGGGCGSLAKPWGTETFFQIALSSSASRKNKRGTERKWIHQGASVTRGGGMAKGVGHCGPCHSTGSAPDNCSPLEVAAATGCLFALITHSDAKEGLPLPGPLAKTWGISLISSARQPRKVWQHGRRDGAVPCPRSQGQRGRRASSHMAKGPGQEQAWQRLHARILRTSLGGVGKGWASFLGEGGGAPRTPAVALSPTSWRTGSPSGCPLPWAFLSLRASQRFAVVQRPE